MNKYRYMAQAFAGSESTTLKELFDSLAETIDGFTEDKQEAIERAIVDHLENALGDEFGLQLAIEDACTEGDDE